MLSNTSSLKLSTHVDVGSIAKSPGLSKKDLDSAPLDSGLESIVGQLEIVPSLKQLTLN